MTSVPVYQNIIRYLVSVWNNRLEKLWEEEVLSCMYEGEGRWGGGVSERKNMNLIFVFPCIIIYGFIRTSLMQIV